MSKERVAVQLINVVLGANMSSRLFEELREKRSLCYDISTEARKYRDSGAFLVHMGLDKSKIRVALTTIIRELSKMKEKEVRLPELSRAKDYLLGQIAMSLERPQGRMFHFAESYLTLGKVCDFEEVKSEIEAVGPLQIKRLAQKIFNFENMCISCVGDMEEDLEGQIRKTIKLKTQI